MFYDQVAEIFEFLQTLTARAKDAMLTAKLAKSVMDLIILPNVALRYQSNKTLNFRMLKISSTTEQLSLVKIDMRRQSKLWFDTTRFPYQKPCCSRKMLWQYHPFLAVVTALA